MRITRDLPSDATAARRARRIIEDSLAGREDLDDLVIIGSELAANASVHGDPPYALTIEVTTAVRLELSNRIRPAGPEVPRIASPAKAESEVGGLGGRGLQIVARLSRDWGWDRQDDSLVVWAEVG